MTIQKEPIGLIGVGLVGTVIAEHLRADRRSVIGFDTAPEARERLRRLGCRVAIGPREVAETVDRVFLSLPDSNVVRRTIEGSAGMLSAQRIPSTIIDTTTGDPRETEALAARLERRDCALLDATICGASSQLRKKEAVLMVGGARSTFDANEALLRTLADRVFYVGPPGSGSKSKLASNLVLGLNRLVLAEGLVFAETLGLDPSRFLNLLKAGPAYSVAMDVKGDKMLRNDFAPESRIQQHRKDVSLMLEHARDCEQDLPLSRLHFDILESAIAAGDGDLDTCAVIREIRRRRIRRSQERERKTR